jgi:hypothetical protein
VYRDDVAHALSLARRTEGRLDASTGTGLCIYRAADGEPMESPRGSLSFASKGKQ